ncbi:hypothetical protein V9T40_008395 [Parthenolecanium corni]|uniref:RRM domain-containing protein n=1 Tax=Parthenolecanium corni TaxID=536013 RepID=A0AAN9TKT5_9HEMI
MILGSGIMGKDPELQKMLQVPDLKSDKSNKKLHSGSSFRTSLEPELYGTIMSTKAIMDKNTNKCRGYGFVDFESDISAENAVKGLQAKGIQAQMAKVGISSVIRRSANHQEQDPTNLYFANLPLNFKEHDLENLLSKFGNVVSTRVLRDEVNISKGVGFARMDAKDKCEKIIQALNGTTINGAKDPLLIKFADGGPKKRLHKTDGGHLYDPSSFSQNGLATTPILPASAITPYTRHYSATQPIAGYSVPTQWLPQYIVQPAPHMTQMDVVPQTDPNAVTYSSMIPQLAAHVSTIQLGTPGSYITASPHPNTYPYCAAAPSIIHTVPIAPSEEHPPNAVSPDDYQPYPLNQLAGCTGTPSQQVNLNLRHLAEFGNMSQLLLFRKMRHLADRRIRFGKSSQLAGCSGTSSQWRPPRGLSGAVAPGLTI